MLKPLGNGMADFWDFSFSISILYAQGNPSPHSLSCSLKNASYFRER